MLFSFGPDRPETKKPYFRFIKQFPKSSTMHEPITSADLPETGFSRAEIAFIQSHRNDDISQLILKAGKFKEFDVKKLAAQIAARQKAVKKLPEWAENKELIFPPALSVEQSSSEATARYKAGLVGGTTFTDITGGMGVDCFYMSRNFETAHYYELQAEVARAAAFNFEKLGAHHIKVHAADSLKSLEDTDQYFDWIYADPARRDFNWEKVVLLSDCTPDVLSHLPILFKNAPDILLKTSPLLDIDLAAKQLQKLKEVHVMGYEQECKELLFVLNRDIVSDQFMLRVRIINADGSVRYGLDFSREDEREAAVTYSKPLSYLYEPHPAVLKAGAFKTVCTVFDVAKLSVNSHLYTSEGFCANFPGRSFEIIGTCKPDMKEIADFAKDGKANLTLRNFPAKIQDLRKKWKLKEGGDIYLFATTLADHSRIIIVTKKPA
ncbi:THUMP-like domain-containing protein [Dyadobacter bucti]|uniref:THUMP-like domain-containing protein n=1 Tax=Dyadobacter bucti TaxID=2572203 RepID=UPI001E44BBCD|nr:hypothetical protein [Dyadobacter bucti]